MCAARRRDDSHEGDERAEPQPAWEDLLADDPDATDSPTMEAMVYCPYCGEAVEIALDPAGGPRQRYVEDCEVCCQPWLLDVSWTADGAAWVDVRCDDGR